MIAAAIDKILSIAAPLTVEVNGDTYSTQKLNKIPLHAKAAPLQFYTLSGLVEYIRKYNENREESPLIVHVVNHHRVEVVTTLDREREREVLAVVEAETPDITLNRFVENEKFVIMVQSMIADDAGSDKDLVLKFAGTVKNGSVKEYSDDGVTQKATIKTGISSLGEAVVPSPCTLRPYRTFIEVEQPTSKFIFRLKEAGSNQIESALFDADGGMWKIKARENIANYLKENLDEKKAVVIS